MPGAKWSDEEKELLKKLLGVGCSLEDIQECLPGRTRPAIYDQVYKSGLSFSMKAPEPDWEKAAKYLEIRKG